MNARPPRILRSFITVGGWTMASRVLGFVRDVVIAAFLGAGPVAEAFVIAFSLPNMFRRFFAEGAFNTAFVPMFASRVEANDNAKDFARDAFSLLFLVVAAFTLIAQLAMPWLVLMMAAGFGDDPGKYALTVEMSRITFPYILLISLAALLSGVLNALHRFAAAAAAPVLLNVIFVAALLLADALGAAPERWLVWAVPVAGLAQLALVWVAASSAGYRLRPRWPKLTPAMRRLAIVAGPAALAGGVVQVNLLVGRQVASFFDGAVAWLYYADRLYQLPLGVVGVAIGVVLLPELARRLRADDIEGAREATARATEIALALTLPAAAALIVVPAAITEVLFGRGAFGPEDVDATALAVAVYGAGLPAFVLQKVYSPIYFAREDTRTPFRFAVISMIVNAVLAIGLAPMFGYLAAAIATTTAGWVNLALLWRGSRQFGAAVAPDERLRTRVPRLLLASILMAGVLLALSALFGTLISQPGWRYLVLGLLVAAGFATFAIASLALGAVHPSDLRKAVRRAPD